MAKRFEGITPESKDWLGQHYKDSDVDFLWQLVEATKHMGLKERVRLGRKALSDYWQDPLDYLENTTWIETKSGDPALLKLNFAQKKFWEDVIVHSTKESKPVRAIILKARQLGFSTLIQAYQFCQSTRNPNRESLTVSYDDESTKSLMSKVDFAFRGLWFPLGMAYDSKTQKTYETPHRSSIRGITSGNQNLGRGSTFHHVHCSEIPFWQDAETTLAGMAQSVPKRPGTSIIWESTAQGMTGKFYDGWKDAESGRSEFQPFFAPWFWDPEYAAPFKTAGERSKFHRSKTPKDATYQLSFELTDEQMHWRHRKIAEPEMTSQLFRQEYPATAEEAFLMSGMPVFDAEAILGMGNRCVAPKFTGAVALMQGEQPVT